MTLSKTQRSAKVLAALLATGLVAGPARPQAEVDAPPLRVVLRGFAKMPQYTAYLDGLVQLCVAAQRLPAGSVVLPSAQVLASLPLFEEETLYDGYWSATFKTLTQLRPDLKGDCKFKLLRTYSANVNKSCSHMIAGSTDGQDSSIAEGVSPTIEVVNEKRSPDDHRPVTDRCNPLQQKPATPIAGLPLVKTTQGTACIWSNDLLNREFELKGRAWMVDKGAQTQDSCVHPKWQRYPTTDDAGGNRIVALKRSKSMVTLGNNKLTDALPALNAAAHQDAVVYEENQSIPAARFTEAAVRAHLSQPAWVSIGNR
jgi:hypothetical protein